MASRISSRENYFENNSLKLFVVDSLNMSKILKRKVEGIALMEV